MKFLPQVRDEGRRELNATKSVVRIGTPERPRDNDAPAGNAFLNRRRRSGLGFTSRELYDALLEGRGLRWVFGDDGRVAEHGTDTDSAHQYDVLFLHIHKMGCKTAFFNLCSPKCTEESKP